MNGRRIQTAAVLAAISLLFILSLAALGCGSSGTSTATNDESEQEASPEDTVDRFFEALEKLDVEMLVDMVAPASVEELEKAYGKDYEDTLAQYFFEGSPNQKFSGLKYTTDVNGKKAEVEVVKGKVTYKDEDGEKVTEDVVPKGQDLIFQMVKYKGEWYISLTATFPDLIAAEPEPGPSPASQPAPQPQPSPEYTVCPDCGGEGGFYIDVGGECPTCFGSGVLDVQDYCPDCGGTGWVEGGDGSYPCDYCGGTGMIWDWVTCGDCGGSGIISEYDFETCARCGGSGWIRSN